jgi:ABC-type polysaccharide/polyol phosphate transport system ATPase subunit
VGDEKFGKKSRNVIAAAKKQNKTILIASHWKPFIKQHCQKIITLKHGKIVNVTYNK